MTTVSSIMTTNTTNNTNTINNTNTYNTYTNNSSTLITCESIEAECNELGMELLNVLEFIGDTIDYRKITLLVQKLSNSMDLIATGVNKLKNVNFPATELDAQLQERREELIDLQEKLKRYQSQ